jgi:hypothetical protein
MYSSMSPWMRIFFKLKSADLYVSVHVCNGVYIDLYVCECIHGCSMYIYLCVKYISLYTMYAWT